MFVELELNELCFIDGGKNWWKIVGGGISTIAGVAGVIVCPGGASKVGSGYCAWQGVTTIMDGWNE